VIVARVPSAYFEALYRRDPDPWGYETRTYEGAKYARTLASCPPRVGSAVELGCSIGVFTARLAPRCDQLLALDFSPAAVAATQARVARRRNVRVVEAHIPEDLPREKFDLVVASEVLYYLDPAALEATVAWFEGALPPGGRLVAVHWTMPAPSHPVTAEAVHEALVAAPFLRHRHGELHPSYRLDVLDRR
jgi:predicted TPR repeat methyltransferase